MAQRVIMQEYFTPIEDKESKKCIWCGNSGGFNKAHIISKALITQNNPNNYLKESVCENCNTYFSKVERWLFKNSPLMILKGGNSGKVGKKFAMNSIPIFLLNPRVPEWLVVHINLGTEPIPQIYINKSGKAVHIALKRDRNKIKDIYELLNDGTQVIQDIKPDLPESFASRIINFDGRIIAIGRDVDSVRVLLDSLKGKSFNLNEYNDYTEFSNSELNGIQNIIMYFKWSNIIWSIYNMKIAYEFMALTLGSRNILTDSFLPMKNWILSHDLENISDLETIMVDGRKFDLKFDEAEIHLDFLSNSFVWDKKTKARSRAFIDQTIWNVNGKLSSSIIISWLPKVTIDFTNNFLDFPILNTINYSFNDSSIKFTRLSNVPNENVAFIALGGEPENNILHDFYKDYIAELVEKH